MGEIVLLFTSSRPVFGPTQPPIKLIPRALSLGVKQSGREVDCLPPTSAGVKNMWKYSTSTPSYAFVGQCLIS
jgi:hypothetical protein